MQIIRFFIKLFIFNFLTILIIIIGLYSYAYFSPPIELSTVSNYLLYDDKDELIYQGSNTSKWVNIKNMSPNLVNAVISVEDKNFYEHRGFDYLRIVKAFFNNFKNKRIVEGASTISQQYIKNAYLSFEKTWSRKIKEALLTLNLEVHYDKDEIIEAYLNTINYGQGNYGVASASQYYFNKDVKDLSLEEAIILAGIPKNPSNYNPVTNYDNSLKRAKIVALTMYNNKYIDKNEYSALFEENIPIYGKKTDNDLQTLMYYHDAVISEVKQIKGINDELLNSGKLKIYTNLNYNAQETMEKNIMTYTKDNKLQSAGVIVNPNTGAIIALTGGIDYTKSQYNRALYSKRQVGSTMKPFLYYAALKNGMTSSSTFTSQYTTFTLSNGKTYSPQNYANIYGNKDITMAAAIAYSDNIYAVKTNLFLGVDELISTAHLCGIESQLQEVASLALGTSELNLLDFASGYNTFASGGYKKDLFLIKKIVDEDDSILYEHENTNNLVLNPNYVFILNELMTSTTNSAFKDYNNPTALGIASKLTKKYALKTGTTDSDYWTVGYNKNVMMVTWTGYDNNDDIAISVGADSKNIWASTIESLEINQNEGWYDMPQNVIGIPLDAVTGNKTNDVLKTNMFYYIKGSEPSI